MDLEKQQTRYEEDNPFKRCQNFIDDPETSYLLARNWKDKFNNALKYMFDCITTLENDQEIKDFSYTIVEECLNFFNSISVERSLTPRLKDFISTFIFLAHNLNENTNKYKAVNKKIQYLQRYCDNAMTFSEYAALLRKVNQRVDGRKKWTPPSFRLSGHYYNLLKED